MARMNVISPKKELMADMSILKAIDALLCKPDFGPAEITRIVNLVNQIFPDGSSPFTKAVGDQCTNLAILHRLSGCTTGLAIWHNILDVIQTIATEDFDRACFLAVSHPNDTARGMAIRLINNLSYSTGKTVDVDTYMKQLELAHATGEAAKLLYPERVYKRYEELNSKRNPKRDAGKAQKEANKAALDKGIEGAEKVTTK
jgi:hypothetical protein